MKNIKPNLLDDLNQAFLIKKDKLNVGGSVKPQKLKPMSSLNGMKSFKPKRSVVKKEEA